MHLNLVLDRNHRGTGCSVPLTLAIDNHEHTGTVRGCVPGLRALADIQARYPHQSTLRVLFWYTRTAATLRRPQSENGFANSRYVVQTPPRLWPVLNVRRLLGFAERDHRWAGWSFWSATATACALFSSGGACSGDRLTATSINQ
jgi:hypothetical protein